MHQLLLYMTSSVNEMLQQATKNYQNKLAQCGPPFSFCVQSQERDDRLLMLCHEWTAERCLLKCKVQEGGEVGIHMKETAMLMNGF